MSAFSMAYVPCIVFGSILLRQHSVIDPAIYDLQILNMRSSLLLPLFAIMIAFCVSEPRLFGAFLVPEAILESVTVYAFLALVVSNRGGSSSIIKSGFNALFKIGRI